MPNWNLGDPDRRRVQAQAQAQAKHIIAEEASEAANVIAKAAELAINTLANAASAAQAVVNIDLTYIKKEMTEIKVILESKYVTKEAFSPVKIITYGMTGIALVGVVGAIVSMVIIRH